MSKKTKCPRCGNEQGCYIIDPPNVVVHTKCQMCSNEWNRRVYRDPKEIFAELRGSIEKCGWDLSMERDAEILEAVMCLLDGDPKPLEELAGEE